jgi:NNP family nitrate/nitrite transporter-like MFS transporter
MSRVTGNSSQGLFGATLGFFIGFAAVSLFGPTAHKFKDVMHLSPVLVGLLVAAPALSGSLLRIPFSAWVDTTGGRKPFLILLLFSIAGMLGLFLVVYMLYPNRLTSGLYPLLLLLGVLSGCGIATFSVGISQVSYWYPLSRQGWALGTYAGIGNIAPGLFSFLLPVALANWGLAGSYLAWLVFLVVGTALYYLWGKNAWYFQLVAQKINPSKAKQIAREEYGQEIFPAGSLTDSLVLSAKIWKTWCLVVIYFTTFGGFIALTAWLPTYWTTYFSAAAVTAGLLTAIYSILTSVIRVVGGSVSDRLGGENTALLALSIMLVGGILMTTSHSFGLSVFGEILMALGMGVGNAAVFKLVPQNVPQAVGGAAGWVGGLGAFGGFAIPPIMGEFVHSQGSAGYAQGFIVFIGLSLISLAVAYTLKRAHATQASGLAVPNSAR